GDAARRRRRRARGGSFHGERVVDIAAAPRLVVDDIIEARRRRESAEDAACRGRRFVPPVPFWYPPSPMPLTGGTRLGPYEILSPIGSGGMGEVYRARDTRLDRTVAIKVLQDHLSGDPARRERFEREARVVSGLNHPHICTLHDVGSQDTPRGP